MVASGSTRAGAKRKLTLEERFWVKVRRGAPDECWKWTGARNAKGYGRINLGARGLGVEKAHRVAWRLTRGDIPGDLCVLHRCDNPSCVNPAHLFLGTTRDNTHDMMRKGRMVAPPHPSGADHHRAVIDRETALRILTESGSCEAVGRRYGVSYQTVSRIRRGCHWSMRGAA